MIFLSFKFDFEKKTKNKQDVAAAVLLAYSARPFSIPEHQVQEQQSQQRQHIASVLGGISMGLASVVCIGIAGKRMLQAVHAHKNQPRKIRMQRILLGLPPLEEEEAA